MPSPPTHIRSAPPAKLPHRVWVEVDLDRFEQNLAEIRRRLDPAVALWLVVKADAYGLGAVNLARHAERCGVDRFGVGNVEEALELRAAGIVGRILVLGTIVDEEAEPAVRAQIELGVHSVDRCHSLDELGLRCGHPARVHLNVDTGMGRLGLLPGPALQLLQTIHAAKGLELAGTMTHLASDHGFADAAAREQVQRFAGFLREAGQSGMPTAERHVGSSAAVFTDLRPQFDSVRIGLAAFGLLAPNGQLAEGLRPVLALRSQIVFFKDVPTGTPIGYGATWRARRPSRIATLPAGYNDGVPWRQAPGGEVLVRGRRAPIVGRVSMDYTTIDVTDVPGASVGDPATLIGEDGGAEISAGDVSRVVGTIPYEITCAIGSRVRRVIRGGDRINRKANEHGKDQGASPRVQQP